MKRSLAVKITAVIAAVLTALTMIPFSAVTTYAEEEGTKPAISIGEKVIEPGQRIWFGSRPKEGGGIEPLDFNWRVLEKADSRAMLISDNLLAYEPFNKNVSDGNNWNTSHVREWCLDYYNDWTGSDIEKEAIAETSKHDGVYQTGKEEIFGELDIVDEHFFLLSAEEADKLFEDNADRLAYGVDGEDPYYWWLRSGRPDRSELAAFVWEGGAINNYYVDADESWYARVGVRPAFNMDLGDIAFVSAAEGGKVTKGLGILSEVPKTDTNEWKLTLHDPNRGGEDGFSAEVTNTEKLKAMGGYTSWSIPVEYSGACTGKNEYVSAMLLDSSGAGGAPGDILYYGNIVNNSESGTAVITIPEGLGIGYYYLYIYSEQKNGDFLTDYAGGGTPVLIEVKPYAPVVDASSVQVTLPEGKTTVTDGDIVKFSARITDEGSVNRARFIFNHSNYYCWRYMTKDDDDVWTGEMEIDDSFPRGMFELAYVNAWDDEGNESGLYNTAVYGTSYDPYMDLSYLHFRVVCKDEHDFGPEEIKKATPDADGCIYHTCSICGLEEPVVPLLKVSNIKLSKTEFVYNGKAVKPEVTVGNASEDLSSDCYTVTYSNNKNAGAATATVTLKGDYYEGSKELPFYICFTDVPLGHSFSKAVYWSTGEGIAAGYTGANAGKFGVADDITRGQVMMFLWRAAGKPEPAGTGKDFTDVPSTNNFYTAIKWGVEQGITGGYTGTRKGQFGPNDNCTRGQIAMFLWRYAKSPKPAAGGKTFSDVPKSNNFYTAVMWASGEGITAGYKDGTFGVNKTCTRGQCVTFLYRLLK